MPADENIIIETREYELIREIARGGMATVYEAKQKGAEGFEKTMAVKSILNEYSSNEEFVKMFIGEAKLVADLVHNNIVQIYQLGKYNDQFYMSMEFIRGYNLAEFMNQHVELNKPMPIEMGAYMISRVCRGLEFAHKRRDDTGKLLGIVHRDISPKNVMIDHDGVVKLTDFGIAKAERYMQNQEGEVLMGKVGYMSPEQAQYKETDSRSDIFSLGIVMYELLTGKILFEEDTNVYQTLHNVIHMNLPDARSVNPDIPEDLNTILQKALERDLDKRYQDVGTMGYDLEHYMYHNRFGPTYTSLAAYLRELFPENYENSQGNIHMSTEDTTIQGNV